MDYLTQLRVQDARRMIGEVDAANITDPDLPHTTAVSLISRLKVTVDTLARHAESQQKFAGYLRERMERAEAEATILRSELGAIVDAQKHKQDADTPDLALLTAMQETADRIAAQVGDWDGGETPCVMVAVIDPETNTRLATAFAAVRAALPQPSRT